MGTGIPASGGSIGRELFYFFGVGLTLLCGVSGLFLTADVVSQEKREGTLGLLLMSRVGTAEVLLGKLAAHSLKAIFGLTATAPVMAVPLLMGGVSGLEVAGMFLSALGCLLVSLSIGLFSSVLMQKSPHNLAIALGGAMSWLVVLPLIHEQAKQSGIGWLWLDWSLKHLNVADLFHSLAGGKIGDFCYGLAGLLAIAASLLRLAVLVLSWTWRVTERPQRKSPMPKSTSLWTKPREEWVARLLDRLRVYRKGGGFPVHQFCDFRKSFWAWTIVMLFVWLALIWSLGGLTFVPRAILAIYGMQLIFKLILCRAAVGMFFDQKGSGALELLLVTPLPLPFISSAYWQSFKLKYGYFAIALAVSWLLVLLFLWIGVETNISLHWTDLATPFIPVLGGLLTIFYDFLAIC